MTQTISTTIGNLGVSFNAANTANTLIQQTAAIVGNVTTGDSVFFINGNTVTGNFTVPAGYNAGSFGPVSAAAGVVVSVPTGQTWTVV